MSTRITATVDPTRSLTDARTGRGHHVRLDTDPPEGDGGAASPKETILAALAGYALLRLAPAHPRHQEEEARLDREIELDGDCDGIEERP